jgi:hypothetical protein
MGMNKEDSQESIGCFCNHAEEVDETGTLHTELMYDELKLKSGYYANFKSGTTTAMAASSEMSTLCLAEELQQLIEQKESEAVAADNHD